jgi:PEGA domain-containing protein
MASLKRELSFRFPGAAERGIGAAGLMLAAALFAFGATPVFAQERPSPQGHGSGEHAVSRPSGGGGSSAPAPSGGGSSTSSSGGSSAGPSGGGGDHAVSRGGGREGRSGGGMRSGGVRGEPRSRSVILPSSPSAHDPGDRSAPPITRSGRGAEYARPRGNRPATGNAVPRTGDISNIPDLIWRRDPYWAYGYWQYSRWMPFYYGPWGGYMYYDPYWWDYYYGYTPGYYGYGGGGYASSSQSDFDTGGLKLKVKPRDAQVYVDGYFSGVVDDYDGVFQKLKLPAGAHRIELRAEGYQPASFDVLVVAGDTVTYRAELKK